VACPPPCLPLADIDILLPETLYDPAEDGTVLLVYSNDGNGTFGPPGEWKANTDLHLWLHSFFHDFDNDGVGRHDLVRYSLVVPGYRSSAVVLEPLGQGPASGLWLWVCDCHSSRAVCSLCQGPPLVTTG
jgi:hypothetical protein